MKQKDRVIQALELKESDCVPSFEWDINEKVVKAITGSEDILEAVEKLDLDGVVIRPDYKREYVEEDVYIDEWGCKRKITTESIAVIIESPIKDLKDYKKYEFPDPYAHHRFEKLERAVQKFGPEKAIILNVRDIFSDIRDLLGYENALIALITEQEYFEKFLNRVIEYNRTLAEIAYKKFNLNILATTDDIASSSGLIFNPKIFFNFLGPKFREVIQGFKDIGYYCIKHCDGNIMPILEYWIDCGIDCIDPIDPLAGMDLALIKKEYGQRVCIKGNVDCTKALVYGTEKEVEEEVKNCLHEAAYGGGYILSSSNTIHSGVKPENYVAMIKALRKYGKYPIEN